VSWRTCTKKYVPLIPKGKIVLPNLLPVSSSDSNSFISETFARSPDLPNGRGY